MTETLAALLFAHVLTDFVLQTNHMAANKHRAGLLALHTLIALTTAIAATGTLHPILVALALAHIGIDIVKTFSGRQGLGPFLIDQAVHGLAILLAAQVTPELWSRGLWSGLPVLPPIMALATGAILATRAGDFAIELMMKPLLEALASDTATALAKPATPNTSARGLPRGGRMIGNLERGLIFLLILSGQAAGIGFLIAAKSVLRFGAVGDDRAASEYVIIGTLASFGWAIAAALLTRLMLDHLVPLGIPDLSP